MQFLRGVVWSAGACALAGLAFVSPGEGALTGDSTTLSFQACPDWTYILPRETWLSADGHFGVPHAGDVAGFASEQTGVMALEIDTNGDGKLDDKIKGAAGYAKLRGKNAAGDTLEYAVRFKFDGGYKWSPSGVVSGKLLGQVVRFIDQDGNGEYDDFGVDAMTIGATSAASFLSKVVNLGGQLYELSIAADGSKAEVTPFTGESGVLDLTSKYASQGDLLSAVVVCGEYSFNAADAKLGLRVPTGKYDLVSGFVKKAGESCWIKRGRTNPILVEASAPTTVTWGGPVVAEFDYEVEDDVITVKPSVVFYGQAGEEYGPFAPEAKSPKILVTDKKTGKLVASGRFGGC